MAKWNYVFVIEWLFISMILQYGCPEYIDIDRNVCLETALELALSWNACRFTLRNAQDSLKSSSSETHTCSRKCNLKIERLKDGIWSEGHYYQYLYQLKYIDLRINGLSKDFRTINTQCGNPNIQKTLKIICNTGFGIADISDGLCMSHKECKDESKTCTKTGQVGFCTCKSGFIGFGNECLKGGNSQASAQGQKEKEDSVVGLMVGAVFGGLILGIVLTVLGGIIYKNIRNGKTKDAKKRDQTTVAFNDTIYETERDADQNRLTEQGTNEKKIGNVPPFTHSVDLPVTKNVRIHHGNKSSMMKSYDVNDDVYNRLHEKEEDSENDETYDHAHENISSVREESDYSNLNTGIRYKEPDVSAAEVNDYDDREPPGDYCALKKQ